MTTKVDAEKINISFGLGVIRKTIKVEKIENIDIVKDPWYYGWEIRLIPNGWLYNINGSDGIELKFNDNKRVIRIGTRNSIILKNEIKQRLNSHGMVA